MVDSSVLYLIGFVIVLVGIALMVAASIGATRGKGGKGKAAGVILIGPVPIIFGTDRKMIKNLMVLGVVLTGLLIAAMLIYYFLFG